MYAVLEMRHPMMAVRVVFVPVSFSCGILAGTDEYWLRVLWAVGAAVDCCTRSKSWSRKAYN